MDSNAIGYLSEYKIATALMEHGHYVSMPLNNSSTYDMIAEINDNLYKIQVKGTIKKPPKNKNGIHINISRHRTYSKSEIDFIAIWVDYFKGFFFIRNQNQTSVVLHPEGKYKKYFNNFVVM